MTRDEMEQLKDEDLKAIALEECESWGSYCGPCLAQELLDSRHEYEREATPAGLLPKDCTCHLLTAMCDSCVKEIEEQEMSKVKPEFPEGMFSKDEEKSIGHKIYGMFKQHLHNDLGITKDYIDKALIKATEDRRKELENRYAKLPEDISKAIGEKIGYTGEGPGPTEWFKSQVRQHILTEINEAIRGARANGQTVTTFQDYVRKVVEDEVRKTIVSKLRVDIKLDLIEPREGELRELIGPEDNFRGVRET